VSYVVTWVTVSDVTLLQVRGRKLIKAAAFKNGVEGDKVDGE
jgi:hypothetical protein